MKKRVKQLMGMAVILLLAHGLSAAGTSKSTYSAGKKILEVTGLGAESLSAELASVSGGNTSSEVIREANSFTHVKQKHLGGPNMPEVTVVLKPGQGGALVQWAQRAAKEAGFFDAKILSLDAQGNIHWTKELIHCRFANVVVGKNPKMTSKLVIVPTQTKMVINKN